MSEQRFTTQYECHGEPGSPDRYALLWIAVWYDGRAEIAIGAPTLDQLARAWKAITGRELDRARAQHVRLYDHERLRALELQTEGSSDE